MNLFLTIAIIVQIILIWALSLISAFLFGKCVASKNKSQKHNFKNDLSEKELKELKIKAEVKSRQLQNFLKYDGSEQPKVD